MANYVFELNSRYRVIKIFVLIRKGSNRAQQYQVNADRTSFEYANKASLFSVGKFNFIHNVLKLSL